MIPILAIILSLALLVLGYRIWKSPKVSEIIEELPNDNSKVGGIVNERKVLDKRQKSVKVAADKKKKDLLSDIEKLSEVTEDEETTSEKNETDNSKKNTDNK